MTDNLRRLFRISLRNGSRTFPVGLAMVGFWTRSSLLAVIAAGACMSAAQDNPAPLLDGMGHHTFPISTDNELAQRYFDQGLVLSYGFNHPEAKRSFLYATQLDPNCAMGFWGAALVLGPNINARMPSRVEPEAIEIVDKALALLDNCTEKEKAMILALEKRYKGEGQRADKDQAYAEAMRELSKQFPEDGDIVTLTAEALMDLHPWNFWNRDGTPKEWTAEITDLLARATTLDPMNPGANHFTIHAWEASPTPERALQAADRLGEIAPGVEHLVHMPSHIYLRVGRYHDATESNIKAADAYDYYADQCRDQGHGPIGGYEMHNWHFMWAAATHEGRSEVALRAAQKFADRQPNNLFLTQTRIRFGKWDDLLAMNPEKPSRGKTIAMHYGKAIAHLRKGNIAAAQKEQEAMLELNGNSRTSSNRLMRGIVAAEIDAAKGNFDEAIAALEEAKTVEDSMFRAELAPWHHPIRHTLGAILIKAGRFEEAEKAYREELENNEEDGWTLFGLMQALEHQGNYRDAARYRARFEIAWRYSDVFLESSRF